MFGVVDRGSLRADVLLTLLPPLHGPGDEGQESEKDEEHRDGEEEAAPFDLTGEELVEHAPEVPDQGRPEKDEEGHSRDESRGAHADRSDGSSGSGPGSRRSSLGSCAEKVRAPDLGSDRKLGVEGGRVCGEASEACVGGSPTRLPFPGTVIRATPA